MTGMATTCGIGGYQVVDVKWADYVDWVKKDYIGAGEDQPKEKEKRMVSAYQVFIINRETEELLKTDTVIGEGESDAMVGFPLTDEMKKLKRLDKLVILTQNIGQFEKFEVQEVRIQNGKIED